MVYLIYLSQNKAGIWKRSQAFRAQIGGSNSSSMKSMTRQIDHYRYLATQCQDNATWSYGATGLIF